MVLNPILFKKREKTFSSLAIWEGLMKMLIDVVPEDSGVLLESFKRMTIENPEDVGKIIVGRMKNREARSLLKKWKENNFFPFDYWCFP